MTDTIVALATAPGPGALAVVRLSGPGSFDVLSALAPGAGALPPPRQATLLPLHDPSSGSLLDRALVLVFPGPASYTGEDVVELSGHGGRLASALLVEACVAAGARPAEPGEFTRRAYLNGKMDLVQAEAVLDVIGSRSRAFHTAALHQLDRGLSGRLAELREQLVHLEALLVHHIDFPEEDEPPVSRERILAESEGVERALERLLVTAPEGELLREGALTVLAGRPNSGKSSLFNALLGTERAIVTEVPGTTRDALEAVVSVEGYPFRFVDTAGIRAGAGSIEQMGIEVARRYLSNADLVIFCVDSDGMGARERDFLREAGGRPVILVRTKVDLDPEREARGSVPCDGGADGTDDVRGGAAGSEEGRAADAGEGGIARRPGSILEDVPGAIPVVEVSALTGEGLDVLRARLADAAFGGLSRGAPDAPVLTRARQVRGVRKALDEVRAFSEALRSGVPAEMAATHIRPAESAIEELLGTISDERVLDALFREFCIGK